MSWLTSAYELDFMQRALIASLLVGVTAPLVGTWILLQRLTYLGDALGHATLGGVAVAYLAGASVTLGAIGAGLVMVILVAVLSRHPRLDSGTIIGTVEVTLFAIGLMLISHSQNIGVDLGHYLFGSVTTVRTQDLWTNVGLAGVVIAGLTLLWDDLRSVTFDPVQARLAGIRVDAVNLALLALLAVSVVLSLQTVGLLMSVALLVVPAAAARLVTRTLLAMTITASAIGAGSSVIGLTLSYELATAPGPTIALVTVAFLVVAWVTTVPRRRKVPHAHASELTVTEAQAEAETAR